jgi:hypothetical protein
VVIVGVGAGGSVGCVVTLAKVPLSCLECSNFDVSLERLEAGENMMESCG